MKQDLALGQRGEEALGIADAVRAGAGHGVVLGGAPGSGRLQVIRAALALAGILRPDVVLFAGERPAARLASLAPWLPPDPTARGGRAPHERERDRGAASEWPSLGQAVAAVGRAWGPMGGPGRAPLVLVEDAAGLDPASAQVLALLCSAERLCLLALTAEEDPGSPATQLLVRDPRVRWMVLRPLSSQAARARCEAQLGGRLTDAAAASLARWGQGNAQLLDAVLAEALQVHALVGASRRWVLETEWAPRGALAREALADLRVRSEAEGLAPSGFQRASEVVGAGDVEAEAESAALRSWVSGWWTILERDGWEAASAAVRQLRLDGLAVVARRQQGTLSVLESLGAMLGGRGEVALEAAEDAVAELSLRDPLHMASAAAVLAGVLASAASGGGEAPTEGTRPLGGTAHASTAGLTGGGAEALALAEACCLVRHGNTPASTLVAAARSVADGHPAVARLVLIELRNGCQDAATVSRLRSLGQALPGGWPHPAAAGVFALDTSASLAAVEAAVRAAYDAGLVRTAVGTLEWALRGTSTPGAPPEELALRRLLGAWVRGLRTAAGSGPLGLGDSVTLTERERDIAARTRSGQSNRQMATSLFLSQRTVEGHLYRAFQKLGISHRAELAELNF